MQIRSDRMKTFWYRLNVHRLSFIVNRFIHYSLTAIATLCEMFLLYLFVDKCEHQSNHVAPESNLSACVLKYIHQDTQEYSSNLELQFYFVLPEQLYHVDFV